MIHALHASHIQMQMPNAKCEMQIVKICNQCDFGWVFQELEADPEGKGWGRGYPLICEQSNQNKMHHTQ